MSVKVLTAKQMREVDRVTVEQFRIPGTTLMQNAGQGVVRLIEKKFPGLERERIAVLCGKGNNGGDGFVVARLLRERGLAPVIVVFAEPEALRGDAREHFRLLIEGGAAPVFVRSAEEWCAVLRELRSATLLVDAILGTGLTGPVEGLLKRVIDDVNAELSAIPVVAVDVPSGMTSDSGEPLGESLHARYTVTFTAPKWCHVLPPNCVRVGDVSIVPIGTPPSVYEADASIYLNLLTRDDLRPFTQPRKLMANKGSFGHVLVIAGSRGKSGAAALASLAALRAGAGLVTAAVPAGVLPLVAAASPVIMTEPLPETEGGTISDDAFASGRLAAVASGKSVFAVGPGLSTDQKTVLFVRKLVQEGAKTPMVLDADALNAFSDAAELLDGRNRTLILTPHPGEMARLTRLAVKDIQSRRVEVAREFAVSHHLYLVLKGYRTLIAEPGGQVYVNPTGNPGMAKGGSGDALTGMIAGLLAQHPDAPVERVVSAAVYWHGAAGDVAAQRHGGMSMLATDLIDAMAPALAALDKPETGRAGVCC